MAGVVQYRYDGATGLLVPEGAKASDADSIQAGSRHAVVYIENAVTGTAGVVALSEVTHSAGVVSQGLAALAQAQACMMLQGLLAGVALLHLAFLWAPGGWQTLSATYMQTWATAAYTLHQTYFVLATLSLVLAWSR
eukprot:jgi/Astpho2/7423/Aster-02006